MAYLDMESLITQASSLSPLSKVMMISNLQILGIPMAPNSSPMRIGTDNVSSTSNRSSTSTTTTSSSSSTLVSSWPTPFSSQSQWATVRHAHEQGLRMEKDDFGFGGLKCMKNDHDDAEREENQHHQERSRMLQLYDNAFPSTQSDQYNHLSPLQFPYSPFPFVVPGYVSRLTSSSSSRAEAEDGKVEKAEEESERNDRRKRRKTSCEYPLDLSKVSSSKSTQESEVTFEPLEVDTPFDSPDLNNDEFASPIMTKTSISSLSSLHESPGSDLNNDEFASPIMTKTSISSLSSLHESPGSGSGASSTFSIKNFLRKQSSPKLFQPNCFDRKEAKNAEGSEFHLFGSSSSLATPPSSSDTTRRRERSLLHCEVCGKAFDRPSLLKRHFRTHTGEKPHICDVCSKGFSTSTGLSNHLRIHSGEKPHQCPICGKRFTASSNLYYHRMNHIKPHKCLLCGKSFPTPGDLKSHQYVHSGSWPYNCPVCHRGFSKQADLRNHLLLHSGITSGAMTTKMVEKPHACHLCDKKFTQACNLRAHLQSHEESDQNQKLLPCSVCKQPLQQSMILEGKCQSCLGNISSLHYHAGNREMALGGSIRKQWISPLTTPHHHHQITPKSNPLPMAKPSRFDNSMLHHRTSTPEQACGASIPLHQTLPLCLNHLGSPGLPHLFGVPLPTGLGLTPSSRSTSSPTAAAGSLFRASPTTGARTSLQPSSSKILEQILEWNFRFSKESAGNLGLSVQQKSIGSQVLAAQRMIQQCSQPSGFGMSTLTSNFQEYFKMSSAFPRVEAVPGENKFGQG